MTQMESPKRKMQKKNDYQRHKLFRKIKRRRKAQAEADQQVAMKQLRKKLKSHREEVYMPKLIQQLEQRKNHQIRSFLQRN